MQRAVVTIDEVEGKRVQRLLLEEPYAGSHELYMIVEFDDDTEVLFEINCQPLIGIRYIARTATGILRPIIKAKSGSIRSLVEER